MPQNPQTQSKRTTRRANNRRTRHQRRSCNKLPQNKYGVVIPAAPHSASHNSLKAIDAPALNRRSSSQSRNKGPKRGFGNQSIARSIMQPQRRRNNTHHRQDSVSAVTTADANADANGRRSSASTSTSTSKMAIVLQRLNAMGIADVDRSVAQEVFQSLGGSVDKTIEFFLPADTEQKVADPPKPKGSPPPTGSPPPPIMSPIFHSPLTYQAYASMAANSPSESRAHPRRTPPVANPQDMSLDDELPSFSLGPAHRPHAGGHSRGSDSYSMLRAPAATTQPTIARPRTTDPFWTIPAEITLEIFEFFNNPGLATISKVSRDARLLVREALSSVSILKFTKYSHWPDRRILSMIECHRRLDTLSMRKCGDFTSFVRLPDAVFPSTLSKLDVSSCGQLYDKDVCAMANGFPNLLTLDVSYTFISDVAIDHIWSKCLRLKDLRLLGCDSITDHGIRSLLTRCTTLTSLNVRKTEITVGAFEDHFGWNSVASHSHAQTPREQQRSRSSSTTQTPILSPAMSPAVAIDLSTPPPASSPSLSSSNSASGSGAYSGRRGSSKHSRRMSISRDVRARGFALANLDMRDCRRISQLIFVSPLCNLQSLNMSFSPSLLRAHLNLALLKSLNISSSKNLKSLMLCLPALETLNLSQCTSLRVFEDPIECPSLKTANLNQCRSLQHHSLASLCSSAAHSLGELNLVGMLTLTDNDATDILTTCGKLAKFELTGCRNVSTRTRRFVERRVRDTETEQRRQRKRASAVAPLDLSDPTSWDFSFLGGPEHESDE